MTRLYFSIFLWSLFSLSVKGQNNIPDSLTLLFHHQLEVFPQEKIYLHTDKPYYLSGEEIWFRAHVVDAATHIPLSISRYVYVELISPADSVVCRIKIRVEEEAYYGHLSIPLETPEGDYTVRAYTMLMQGLDECYFCTKPIRIGNPQSRNHQIETRAHTAPANDFDISFYPEGGALIQGVANQVAFKALNAHGQAIDVSGVVYDQSGTEITTFQSTHLGMGLFPLLPEKGKTYWVMCENEQGQSMSFDLPKAMDRGYALCVLQSKDKIYVSVGQPAESTPSDAHYLLAHTRGMVYFAAMWDQAQKTMVFQKARFPSGVLHFILFDSRLTPISERLVFVHNPDQAMVTCRSDQKGFAPRSLVKNSVTISDHNGAPLTGNFSVAVTSDKEVAPASANILTHLLLTSDLRGHIEHPAYYFEETSDAAWALDLLMRTQGWRRYNVAELAQGRFSHPTFPVEWGAEISGTVKSVLMDKPIEDIKVNMISLRDGLSYTAHTDRDGYFRLPFKELPDSAQLIVSVDMTKSMTRMNLTLDSQTFPAITIPATPSACVDNNMFAQYINKAELKYTYENGSRTYADANLVTQLQAIVVTAERKPLQKSNLYSNPSNIIAEEEIEDARGMDIYELLSLIPGVRVSGKNILIRGASSIYGDPRPMLIVDNVPYDMGYIDMIPLSDMAQIDVLKGNDAVIVGSMTGAISIFTKRGRPASQNTPPPFHIKTIAPLGFQQPVAFYAPKYDTPEQNHSTVPDLRTTIHWQPVVQTDPSGAATFEFYTADEQTSYTITIEGTANNGGIIWQEVGLWTNSERK